MANLRCAFGFHAWEPRLVGYIYYHHHEFSQCSRCGRLVSKQQVWERGQYWTGYTFEAYWMPLDEQLFKRLQAASLMHPACDLWLILNPLPPPEALLGML